MLDDTHLALASIVVFGSLIPTVWMAAVLVRAVRAKDSRPPGWLEWMMPVRGRWLGYLLAAPIAVVMLALVLAGSFLVLATIVYGAASVNLR